MNIRMLKILCMFLGIKDICKQNLQQLFASNVYNLSFPIREYNHGNDMRFPLQEENDIYNIQLLFEKKKILDILSNPKIHIQTKTEIIDNHWLFNDSIATNITAGSLFSDWNLE